MLRTLFPLETTASFTVRIFGGALALCALVAIAAMLLRSRRLSRAAAAGAALVAAGWATLHVTRPDWLRYALATPVAIPRSDFGGWTTRAPGLETGDIDLSIDGRWVDHVALCRLDPRRYRFSVHWDGSRSRTVEDWQRTLDAAVVINGSYFLPEGAPQTPLRMNGRAAGPTRYASTHGAFVAGDEAAILDLRGSDVFAAIGPFPEAMVSYPLLLDQAGDVRAPEAREWLASRSFVALDRDGRVILGTTRTGFFTLRRLGEYLKTSPLGIRIALNFDGGPVASQMVKTPAFERVVVGSAEITDGGDVARAFYQAHRRSHWTLPIVLAAAPR